MSKPSCSKSTPGKRIGSVTCRDEEAEKTSVNNPLIRSNCIGSVLMNSVNSCAPFVNIMVGGMRVSSLVDTGSLNVSVLSEDFWK